MDETTFLSTLESIIAKRLQLQPEGSYTANLAAKGLRKVAQKVGEEGLEVALAAVAENDDRVTAEAADLIFHLLVLLHCRELCLADVIAELEARHNASE